MNGSQAVRGGLNAGRWAGVQVRLDWSLLFIFALIVVDLGVAAWPQMHPQWSAWLVWSMAFAAAALFFLTVLLHELSHALVARAFGVDVHGIVLFLFGGMAMMRGRPRSAGAELAIAAAGPIASIVIGLGSLLVLGWSADTTSMAENPQQALAALNPGQTLLAWLGPINLLLAAFNLIPGFPLDGGRLLRAVLWYATNDLRKATRWATGAGRLVAVLLMSTGIVMILGLRVPVFGTGLVAGLWLLLIGWFLYTAARASYAQLVMQMDLQGVRVSELMRENVRSLDPSLTLDEVVRAYLLGSDQQTFPVLDEDRFVGLLTLDDVRRVPREKHVETRVSDVMSRAGELNTLEAEQDAATALERLGESRQQELPVMSQGHFEGLLKRADILRYLSAFGRDSAWAR